MIYVVKPATHNQYMGFANKLLSLRYVSPVADGHCYSKVDSSIITNFVYQGQFIISVQKFDTA